MQENAAQLQANAAHLYAQLQANAAHLHAPMVQDVEVVSRVNPQVRVLHVLKLGCIRYGMPVRKCNVDVAVMLPTITQRRHRHHYQGVLADTEERVIVEDRCCIPATGTTTVRDLRQHTPGSVGRISLQ